MFHFVEHHGVEALVIYYIISAVLGTIPPLPANAGYWSKWAFAAIQAFSGNLKSVANSLNLQSTDKTPLPPSEYH